MKTRPCLFGCLIALFLIPSSGASGPTFEHFSEQLWAAFQSSSVQRMTFDVASVKPNRSSASGSGVRGDSGQGDPAASACSRSALQATPGRFAVSNATLYSLIALAYDKPCALVSGGPEWIRSDQFDIEARLPEGSPTYTVRQLENGDASRLQEMIQTLLADRFRLALRHEVKELAVYNLVVVKSGKMKLSKDQNPPDGATGIRPLAPGAVPTRCPCIGGGGGPMSISRLARVLEGPLLAGRPIIDKTGLRGGFDIQVSFGLGAAPGPSIFSAIEEQLGLKLEPAKALVEVLVIDHAQRPSEN